MVSVDWSTMFAYLLTYLLTYLCLHRHCEWVYQKWQIQVERVVCYKLMQFESWQHPPSPSPPPPPPPHPTPPPPPPQKKTPKKNLVKWQFSRKLACLKSRFGVGVPQWLPQSWSDHFRAIAYVIFFWLTLLIKLCSWLFVSKAKQERRKTKSVLHSDW